MYRFFQINASNNFDLLKLCRILSQRSRQVWLPGGKLPIDESVYEYLGASPAHVFIPRKPHPNGQMSYGLSCRSAVQEMPCLIDFEPYIPGNKVSARTAARLLINRFVDDHPELAPQFVMDAAFGSFSEIEYYRDIGANVTYSMTSKENKWLWDLLLFDCPVDHGRAAIFPFSDGLNAFLVSAFRGINEKGKIIDILTMSSGFTATPPEETEPEVAMVEKAQVDEDGQTVYRTTWANGDVTMEPVTNFMDEDGTFNVKWLSIATSDDIKSALDGKTIAELQTLLDTQGWKVNLLFSLILIFLIYYLENWEEGSSDQSIC
jgi:hypothetical protein